MQIILSPQGQSECIALLNDALEMNLAGYLKAFEGCQNKTPRVFLGGGKKALERLPPTVKP